MNIPILTPEKHWVCPNCDTTSITRNPEPHTQMHPCGGMNGFIAPMVEDGIKAKVEAVERGDYVNEEIVTYMDKDGHQVPIMSVVTTRDEGQDCAVYAPTARGD
jgi:hypothetical protein